MRCEHRDQGRAWIWHGGILIFLEDALQNSTFQYQLLACSGVFHYLLLVEKHSHSKKILKWYL